MPIHANTQHDCTPMTAQDERRAPPHAQGIHAQDQQLTYTRTTALADVCMLHFASAGAHSKGVIYCGTCHTNVKVNEVLKRPIFNSYQWGNNLSTQKIAVRLCERVFLATEMPYWLDIDGGMGFGDELVSEMQEGVKNCKVVTFDSCSTANAPPHLLAIRAVTRACRNCQ